MKYERLVIRTSSRDELEEEILDHSEYRFVQAIEWSGADYFVVFEREVSEGVTAC
jgi:hypothetical protein